MIRMTSRFGGCSADHRLERFVEIDRAVGKPLDVQVALLDRERAAPGPDEQDLPQAPVEHRRGADRPPGRPGASSSTAPVISVSAIQESAIERN